MVLNIFRRKNKQPSSTKDAVEPSSIAQDDTRLAEPEQLAGTQSESTQFGETEHPSGVPLETSKATQSTETQANLDIAPSAAVSMTESEQQSQSLASNELASDQSEATNPIIQTQVAAPVEQEAVVKKPTGLFARLSAGLKRTRANLTESMASLILGRKQIDEDLLEAIEMQLLTADVGVEATQAIIADLTDRVSRKQLADPEQLYRALKDNLAALLEPCEKPLVVSQQSQPMVILVVGVNGNGKTTTIGKLAKQMQQAGKSVLLAAGDTFRAAAIEQLQAWGERNQVPVIAQHQGADSASVIYDALQAAKARQVDVVIADTAGRLHTQSTLMDELKKIKRVLSKQDPQAPHEVLLVLDAGTGQNALAQTEQFKAAVDVSGIVLTKLDGTAKGGVIFALAKKFALPIPFIGIGEGVDDLRAFRAKEFVEALFTQS